MRLYIVALFLLFPLVALSQSDDFPYGAVSLPEMQLMEYPSDTSAAALVLREWGHAAIDYNDQIRMVYKYHVRIKVLKPKGQDRGNVDIYLLKDKKQAKTERLLSMKASSFNIVDGRIKETKIGIRDAMTKSIDEDWDLKRFAIPSVSPGTVIEYEYEVETPSPWFSRKLKTWNFQSDIPKLYSEFWATIPGNFEYHIALRGMLKLARNESSLLKGHFRTGAGTADCARYKWAIENVPAFYEEEYMTSKKNFLAAINFELKQVKHFDGSKDEMTKEWRDVEQELRTWDKFGQQLKRGGDVVDEKIEALLMGENDPFAKAEKVFQFVREWYSWNEEFGYYTENGIRRAFENRKGNVGDINISLIAALRHAGLDAEPMLLSTRANGLPTELFPIMTEFNYVVAKLNINDKVYLLDATDDLLPFGLLPERCLNGKGRVLGDKNSYWYDIKPAERARQVSIVNLSLGSDGVLAGTIKTTYSGYRGARKRGAILSSASAKDYIGEIQKDNHSYEITEFSYENLEEVSKPLVETLTIRFEDADLGSSKSMLFNPFVTGRWTNNPFHLSDRIYPVDFGTPIEETWIMSVEYPEGVRVADLPEKAALALPKNGGRFVYDASVLGQKLNITSSLLINRPVFMSDEYPSLKEFFNRVVKIQGSDVVIEKI